MGYSSRRKIDRVAIGFAALAFGGVGAAAAAIGDGERITQYSAAATVDATGTAQVSEVIEYDFGPEDKRGIFRDVPDLAPDAPITVDSATAPDQFIIQPGAGSGGETRIRIGNPDVTIDGRHRYAIDYPVDITDDTGADGDRISWNAIGPNWDVSMSNITIHLAVANRLTDLRCSQGSFGSVGGCDVEQPEPGLLVVSVDSLGSRQGVTVSAARGQALAAAPALPEPLSLAPEDPGSGVLPPAGTATGLGLLAASAASVVVRRAGREWVWAGGSADAAFGPGAGQDYPTRRVDNDELEAMVSTEFAPPKDISAWQGGMLHREHQTRDHQVAWLLERAITEEIAIDGTEDLTLRRLNKTGSPHQGNLDRLFGGNKTVELGTYDKRFASAWSDLGNELGRWLEDSDYWDASAQKRPGRAMGFGAVLLLLGVIGVAGFAVAANRAGPVWLVGVGLAALAAGVGYGLLQRAWELKVRTPAGSGMWILIESFRRFIHNSDAQHVANAAKQGVLLDYTAWAVALGEVDHWTEVMEEADLEDVVAPQALRYSTMAPTLAAATVASSTAPSSSGSGGGGGSVGGGGGGGGGGSW